MKFYRNEQIEQIAEQRLSEFQQKLGRPLSFPIDIELFGDLVLGLSILWEEIEEMPGEEVLAGLRASDRLIVMNERRKDEMEQKPGRRRLTQGHEMGHWDLFVDISKLDHPGLFDAAASGVFAYRSATGGQVQILLSSEQGRDILRQINARADSPDEARSVNRYAASILMPRSVSSRKLAGRTGRSGEIFMIWPRSSESRFLLSACALNNSTFCMWIRLRTGSIPPGRKRMGKDNCSKKICRGC